MESIKNIEQFGKPQNLPTGHDSRHLKKVLPIFKEACEPYWVELPVNVKEEVGRSTKQFPMLFAHEELEEKMKDIEGWEADLEEKINEGQFPKAFLEHLVVTQLKEENNKQSILPLSMFIDGVPYSNVDEIEGIWIINMLTERMHFVCCI